ncbi:MAG TPA: DUF2254 family protein, partial [Sphingomicrobium sp.]|nr:DUF2254 family protein [Sphingomicrobium sp.]
AVNDPGSAIDVLNAQVRLITRWSQARVSKPKVKFSCLYIQAPLASDLISDALGPISRDGADNVEVAIRIEKSLAALVDLGPEDLAKAARTQADLSQERASRLLTVPADRKLVSDAAPKTAAAGKGRRGSR